MELHTGKGVSVNPLIEIIKLQRPQISLDLFGQCEEFKIDKKEVRVPLRLETNYLDDE